MGKVETVKDIIFLGSKLTADGDCRHNIKRYLHLGRKPMTNLDSVLKSRDITLMTKVHIVKVMAFPVVMHGQGSLGSPWGHKESDTTEQLTHIRTHTCLNVRVGP